MPIFEFECKQCGERFEELAPAPNGVSCPACGSTSINLVTRPHVDVPFHCDATVGVVAHVQLRSPREPGPPQVWMTYGIRSYAQLNLVVRIEMIDRLIEKHQSGILRM